MTNGPRGFTLSLMKRIQRVITIASLVVIVLLFGFFLRDVLIPLVRFQIANDVDGARELLISRGVLGFLTVILVEALQMVVVFIPAEFIQISSGLSYPFLLALLLCDLGICLGATIIFVLVRVFRFSNDAYRRKEAVIDKLAASKARKDRSVMLLLYFLFIMPFIPFGAICYYGSSQNLKYRRYILTVATGVIPSIVISNLMGAATRYFLIRDLPLPVLLLVILLLAVLLFAVLFLYLDRVYFRENDGTPDSPVYLALFKTVAFLCRRRANVKIDDSLIRDHEKPYLFLSNHESFWDFYYIHRLIRDRNVAYVLNRFYFLNPILRWIGRKTGMIPKRLFTTDFETPVRIMRTLRKGYTVVVFPEGRLSPDGRSNPMAENSASFFRRLNVDIVLGRIRGAYFGGPKWRKRSYPGEVQVSAVRILTPAEIKAMTDEELQSLMADVLAFDESEEHQNTYPQKDKAEGLENLLYRCADCGALYATEGVGNDLVCRACGKVHSLDEKYRFTSGPATIGAYYERIKEMERAELDHLHLETPVHAVMFQEKRPRKVRSEGVCTLTRDSFTFRSAQETLSVPISQLPALPFSCDEEFETYFHDDLYYFYPVENRRQAVRWALLVDLLHEKNA